MILGFKPYCILQICIGVNNLPVDFSEMASDEKKRRQFLKNTITYILNHNFVGLDLSWDISKERFEIDQVSLFKLQTVKFTSIFQCFFLLNY